MPDGYCVVHARLDDSLEPLDVGTVQRIEFRFVVKVSHVIEEQDVSRF